MAVSCGIGRRRGSGLALLWLWCGPVATAPIGPLAWELPYAMGAALKKKDFFFFLKRTLSLSLLSPEHCYPFMDQLIWENNLSSPSLFHTGKLACFTPCFVHHLLA